MGEGTMEACRRGSDLVVRWQVRDCNLDVFAGNAKAKMEPALLTEARCKSDSLNTVGSAYPDDQVVLGVEENAKPRSLVGVDRGHEALDIRSIEHPRLAIKHELHAVSLVKERLACPAVNLGVRSRMSSLEAALELSLRAVLDDLGGWRGCMVDIETLEEPDEAVSQ
jgi:hypothetical protein